MKAYGFKRKDLKTCAYGCCKLRNHPDRTANPNAKAAVAMSARKAARRRNKELCVAE